MQAMARLSQTHTHQNSGFPSNGIGSLNSHDMNGLIGHQTPGLESVDISGFNSHGLRNMNNPSSMSTMAEENANAMGGAILGLGEMQSPLLSPFTREPMVPVTLAPSQISEATDATPLLTQEFPALTLEDQNPFQDNAEEQPTVPDQSQESEPVGNEQYEQPRDRMSREKRLWHGFPVYPQFVNGLPLDVERLPPAAYPEWLPRSGPEGFPSPQSFFATAYK